MNKSESETREGRLWGIIREYIDGLLTDEEAFNAIVGEYEKDIDEYVTPQQHKIL